MTTESNAATLAGKVALVTGAAWGIGRAVAIALAEAGADVAVGYHESEAAANDVVARVRGLRRRARAVQADVTEPAGAQHLVAETTRELGPPDVLVNNVGDFLLKTVAETTSKEWKRVFASNVDSVFLVTRPVLLHMRDQGWGRIVNLTSAPVERQGAAPRTAAYTAAKAAVWSFTRSLAREEIGHGVTVNAVAPGLVDTGPERVDAAFREYMEKLAPTGRLATPEEVARVVAFLCLPASGYVTGTQVSVGGGWAL